MELQTKQYQHEILYNKTSETHFACEAEKNKIKLITVESSHTAEKKTLYFHSHFISQTCNHSAITCQKPDKGRLCVLLKKTQGNYTKLPKTMQYLAMIRPFDNESSQTVALISHNPKLKRYYSCNPYIYDCVYR